MSEDKMREEFEATLKGAYLLMHDKSYADPHIEARWQTWKACAAIKDAEIAALKKQTSPELMDSYQSLQEDFDSRIKEIASRDLMIKDLREALKGEYTENKKNGCETLDTTLEALAKSEHHNSKALEKMLLEAEERGYKRGIIRGQNSLN